MIKDKLRNAYAFDLRSLALYRITLGICIFLDLVWRMRDLTAHYSDFGILTRSAWITEVAFDWNFSFHAFSGNPNFVAIIFIIHLIVAACFISGFKTRLMSFLLFILTCSLHDRVWVFNNGGDDILRLVLFYSIFLPVGHKYSIDHAMDTESKPFEKSVFNIWVIAFTFQLFAVYFFSALLKNSPIWYKDFTATYFALMLDIFALPLGKFIWQFPGLLKGITIWSIWLEWAGALAIMFIFVFWKWAPKIRFFLMLNFIAFHLGIALTMDIGIFPWIAICCWLVFIPSFIWDWIEKRNIYKDKFKLNIFYDQECGFCKKGVLILKSWFLMEHVSVLPAQSQKDINELMLKENSWVIVDGAGVKHTHFKAVIAMSAASPILQYFQWVIDNRPVAFIGDRVYRFISNNRMLMGQVTKYFSFSNLRSTKISIVSFLFGLFSLAVVCHWNFSELPEIGKNDFLGKSAQYLHLYQRWNMFAPHPKPFNIWFEVPGVLSDGTKWDLITDKPYDSVAIKENFYDSITNKQWRKFFLVLGEDDRFPKFYSEYLCKKWNLLKDRKLDVDLEKLAIIYYRQQNLLYGQKEAPIKSVLWNHHCLEK